MVNIKSDLDHVTQQVRQLAGGEASDPEMLLQLVTQLEQAIHQAGETHTAELQKLAQRLGRLIDDLAAGDEDTVEMSGRMLLKTAKRLDDTLPAVARLAKEIGQTAVEMV